MTTFSDDDLYHRGTETHDAPARDCETASVQATPMAERLYAALGFRALRRILEHVLRAPSHDVVRPQTPAAKAIIAP
jgi:hypothetical protein